MVNEFKNKWGLILGGSSGLGFATAKKLARHGMNIIVVHRSPRIEAEKLRKTLSLFEENGIKAVELNVDALNKEKQQELAVTIKELIWDEKIYCLVHSIAKGNLKPMTGENSLRNDDLHITLNAMAFSLYDWVKLVFDTKLFADDARIIAFTSEGSSKAWPNYGAVSAAKASLEAISRSIALEFAPYGIHCNCIMAGVTDTASLRMIPGSDSLIKYSIERNPYKRLTLPEDVANAVYLLCRQEAGWINGTVIPVNGGEHLQ